ncbi:MAG: radical SAM protein [Planctomycetes bacterium]|jgi:23S rRNA (adenine2503-C2)-methyltransferase|nr:radical SAM protein [Planctomycetota bacterium]
MPLDLLATPADELAAAAARHFGSDKGSGLAAAIFRRAMLRGEFAPEALGASPATALAWRELAELQLPQVVGEQQEATAHGAVHKRLLALRDGRRIESVSLPMGRGRRSLCLSTQVGCARACTFCETGRLGLLRNLDAGEILAQVTLQCREQRPDSLVFMGMGEPLDNLPGLLPALALLVDRRGLGYAQERLTVCTVGHVPGLHALRELGWKRLGIALSLNSADPAVRAALMPHSVRYSLAAIQRALIDYRQRANLAIGLHWCLLPGINDGAAEARALAAFAAPLGRTFVHVIPYNPGSAPIARAPEEAEIVAFVARLRELGLAVRRRQTKGRTVMAACGQLGGPPVSAS